MAQDRLNRTYLIGAVIVWVAIWIASGAVLRDTDQFSQMVPILGGGTVWFVVLVPALLRHELPPAK